MNNKIIELESHKDSLINKKKLDNKEIELDGLLLDEVEGVKKLYINEIMSLEQEIKALREENIRLLKNRAKGK